MITDQDYREPPKEGYVHSQLRGQYARHNMQLITTQVTRHRNIFRKYVDLASPGASPFSSESRYQQCYQPLAEAVSLLARVFEDTFVVDDPAVSGATHDHDLIARLKSFLFDTNLYASAMKEFVNTARITPAFESDGLTRDFEVPFKPDEHTGEVEALLTKLRDISGDFIVLLTRGIENLLEHRQQRQQMRDASAAAEQQPDDRARSSSPTCVAGTPAQQPSSQDLQQRLLSAAGAGGGAPAGQPPKELASGNGFASPTRATAQRQLFPGSADDNKADLPLPVAGPVVTATPC